MQRVLAFDVGERRIGVAVSDAMGWTAQGLTTYERAADDLGIDVPDRIWNAFVGCSLPNARALVNAEFGDPDLTERLFDQEASDEAAGSGDEYLHFRLLVTNSLQR